MKQLLIVLSTFVFFLCACNKEKIISFSESYVFNINANCIDIDIPELPSINNGYKLILDSNLVSMPFFNPNNSNEFLFYQLSTKNIYVYNRLNNSKKILINTSLLFPAKWGKKNWILINDGGISMIKSNGESLTKIINSESYNPEWNIDGNKFAFQTTNWNIGRNIEVIYDINNNTKDTLPFMLNSGKCWQNNANKMIFHSTEQTMNGFVLVDMNSKTRTLLNKIESPSPPCWINDNEFVYCLDQKIYVFNIQTGISKAIALLCSNDFVSYMSYSPISNELMTSLTHWKSRGGNKIFVTSKIMILNFNDNSVSYITP